MRGAQGRVADHSMGSGIIPAYAGSTHYAGRHELSGEDHPRVCGEHNHQRWPSFVLSGSSPRMRGALRWEARLETIEGIIPAYAGSTSSTVALALPAWDHPRVCGEHWPMLQVTAEQWGSSPRMRGAPSAS